VLEVEGNRIERMAVTFLERRQPQQTDEELLAADDELE